MAPFLFAQSRDFVCKAFLLMSLMGEAMMFMKASPVLRADRHIS
jgi:hypothetical protein